MNSSIILMIKEDKTSMNFYLFFAFCIVLWISFCGDDFLKSNKETRKKQIIETRRQPQNNGDQTMNIKTKSGYNAMNS